MMRKDLTIAVAVTGILAAVALSSCTGDDNPVALAKALPEASVSLDQGLKASESEGKPISGEYEIEDGALQLSVNTMKGDQFSEVIVDHKTGAVKNAEKITDADDLKDAKGTKPSHGRYQGVSRQSRGRRHEGEQRLSRGERCAYTGCGKTGGQHHAHER